MRAAWGHPGSDPPYPELDDNGIRWPYFDIREPRLTPTYLDAVCAHPAVDGVGVYAVASWQHEDEPEAFAEWVDARLRHIGWLGNPPVCLDVEVADLADYCVRALTRWRELRPKRVTDLTIEGHKGGLFSPAQVVHVVAKVRYTVPQCYNGALSQVWDSYAMACDLVAAGFPIATVCPFYDAAHLPEWWGLPAGYAFTWERLP